jgi:hypothetical protein
MSARKPGPPVDPAPVCGACGSTSCRCLQERIATLPDAERIRVLEQIAARGIDVDPSKIHFLGGVGDVFVRARPSAVVYEGDEGAIVVLSSWYAGGTLDDDEKAQIDRGQIEDALERAKAAEAEEALGLSIEPGAMTTEQDALLAESAGRRVLLGIRERLAVAREKTDERQ